MIWRSAVYIKKTYLLRTLPSLSSSTLSPTISSQLPSPHLSPSFPTPISCFSRSRAGSNPLGALHAVSPSCVCLSGVSLFNNRHQLCALGKETTSPRLSLTSRANYVIICCTVLCPSVVPRSSRRKHAQTGGDVRIRSGKVKWWWGRGREEIRKDRLSKRR